MILKDENGNEYEFEEQVNHYNKDKWLSGTLKPIDEWPKEGELAYFINPEGKPFSMHWNNLFTDTFMGYYRTKEEAEMAAERIRSLQEATSVDAEIDDTEDKTIYVSFVLPKKNLKAWKELSE